MGNNDTDRSYQRTNDRPDDRDRRDDRRDDGLSDRARSRDPITETSIQGQDRSHPSFADEVAPGSDNPTEQKRVVAASPFTAEDPSRGPGPQPGQAPNYPGFPKTKYHPVYGAREAKDPNEAALFSPPHNWFDTAEEADAHRTDREAQTVIHHNRSVKIEAALSRHENPEHETDPAKAMGDAGVVRNSVAATEAVKAGKVEPL